MEKSTSYHQEIQQKVGTASITNEIQNAKIHPLMDQEANTSSCGNSGNQHRDYQFVNSIKEMAGSLEPPLSSKECCIYRIPTLLRNLNEEAYTPMVISIGPFHHGRKRLETMEKLKLKYFKKSLQWIDFNVEILVNAIKTYEESVRSCYAKTIEFSSDDFVKLNLVDGIFIIELFHEIWTIQGASSVVRENNILLNQISSEAMVLDMLDLLENQLPFFVLEILFRHAYAPYGNEYPSFTSLAIKVFERSNRQEFPGNLGEQPIRHFVHLTIAFLLLSSRKLLLAHESNNLPHADHIYSASQLHEARVKFKVSSSKCLFDLKFTNGMLEIPRIILDTSTETSYRNVIAFEQFHYSYESHLTNYIMLLSFLISTPKDADLLIRKGIVINGLHNSNAVASFLTNLSTNVIYNGRKSEYHDLFKDSNAFYENTKHTWKSTLKRDYFGTPWKIASTAAAVTLLLLTLVQTICSIIQAMKM